MQDRPSTFEFTATGGSIATPDDDPHRHTFTFTPEGDGTRIRVVRRDPLPPNWSRVKRCLTPVVVTKVTARTQGTQWAESKTSRIKAAETGAVIDGNSEDDEAAHDDRKREVQHHHPSPRRRG